MLPSILTLSFGLVQLVHSATLDIGHGINIRDTLPRGYVVSNITWSGFEEIGVHTKISGTLESILEQMPNTKEALHVAVESMGGVSQFSHNHAQDLPPSDNMMLKCMDPGLNFDVADIGKIQDGIAYLSAMDETKMCSNEAAKPGQGTCGRVSCSHDSGIWFCNDNEHYVEYPCRIFASFAQTIISTRKCYTTNQGYPSKAKGQYFDLDNGINVIVGAPFGGC